MVEKPSGHRVHMALFGSVRPTGPYWPMGQMLPPGQASAPFTRLKVPEGHCVQDAAPAAEKVPARQVAHDAEPAADEYVPARHREQEELVLAAVANLPAGQMAQAARVVPGLETPKPSAQNAQAASEVLSEASVRTPVGHLVHVEAPAAA